MLSSPLIVRVYHRYLEIIVIDIGRIVLGFVSHSGRISAWCNARGICCCCVGGKGDEEGQSCLDWEKHSCRSRGLTRYKIEPLEITGAYIELEVNSRLDTNENEQKQKNKT